MKRIAIYPFSYREMPLYTYFSAKGFPVRLAAPVGFGLNGRDASFSDARKPTGQIVEEDIFSILDSVDCLYITACPTALEEGHFQKLMGIALEKGVEVFCGRDFIPNEIDLIPHTGKKGSFHYSGFNGRLPLNLNGERRITNITVPTVFIGEMVPNLNGLEILCRLILRLEADGKKAAAFGASPYLSFIGQYDLSPILNSKSITDEDKIYGMNEYIQSVSARVGADCILVLLPGGLMRYNDNIDNGFGVPAFLVSQALSPDCFIYCLLYGHTDPVMLDMSNTLFENRFGFSIDCCHMSNCCIDHDITRLTKTIQLYHVGGEAEHDSSESDLSAKDFPAFDLINDEKNFEYVYESIRQILEERQGTRSLLG